MASGTTASGRPHRPIGGVDAVLFDFDGTLWLSEHRNLAVWTRFLTDRGVEISDGLLESFMGRRMRDVLTEQSRLFPGSTVPELLAELRALSSDPGLPEAQPAPGAADFVADVAESVRTGVVTSALRERVTAALQQMDVLHHMDILVTCEDTKAGKPSPDGYLMACERLCVSPGAAIAFEDSPAGVRAAKVAGMSCVGVAGSLPADALAEADLVVRALPDVNLEGLLNGRWIQARS